MTTTLVNTDRIFEIAVNDYKSFLKKHPDLAKDPVRSFQRLQEIADHFKIGERRDEIARRALSSCMEAIGGEWTLVGIDRATYDTVSMILEGLTQNPKLSREGWAEIMASRT
jgi:hypothetical protein